MTNKVTLTRRSISAAILAAPFAATPYRVSAQQRYVTLVVPYVPGGAVDTFARLFAKAYGQQTGSTIVVENHGGASGAIGLAKVAGAVPDGRTLLYTYGNLALAMLHTVKDSPNILTDLTPVARSVITQGILATGPHSKLKSLGQLLVEAKKAPGKLTYADYGELAVSRMMYAAGIDMLRVPYKGGTPGLTDVMAGQVDLYAGSASLVLPQVQSGKLQALAVTSPRRMPQLPGVPTVSEQLPNYTALNYQGVFAPRNMAMDVLLKVEHDVMAAITHPSFKKAVAERFADVDALGARDFRAFLVRDGKDIGQVIKSTRSPR